MKKKIKENLENFVVLMWCGIAIGAGVAVGFALMAVIILKLGGDLIMIKKHEITLGIIYVLKDCPEYGLMDDYSIFGW